MVDRDRSKIRSAPSFPVLEEDTSDRVEVEHELNIETNELAAHDLAILLGEEDDLDLGSSTVRLEANELAALLARTRQALPSVPESRPLLATQPYDAIIGHGLPDKDLQPSAPEIDVLEEEADLDVELVEAGVTATPSAIPVAPAPLVSPPPAARASLPSATMEWPGARDRKRRTMILVAIGAALLAIAILYFSFAEPAPLPAPPTDPAAPAPMEMRPVLPIR